MGRFCFKKDKTCVRNFIKKYQKDEKEKGWLGFIPKSKTEAGVWLTGC